MSTKTFEAHLEKINQGFKAAKLGVSIRQRKNSLSIRATLPPKPSSTKTKNHQQEIPTGCKAQMAGLKTAKAMAKEVAGKIAGKTFDWADYGVEQPKDDSDRTVAEWIAAYEQDYFERRKRTPTSEGTFNTHYRAFFQRLPQAERLTPKVLRATIVQTEPDSSPRKDTCLAFTRLGRFAQMDVKFIQELKGTYKGYKPAPRDLPADDEIVRAILAIANPNWQWVFGMVATYGLRPHEAFRIEQFDFPNIELSENTKTGRRTVRPLHPHWIEVFDLKNIRYPNVDASPERPNRNIGRSMCVAAKAYGLPFPLYHLRHCWAVRAIEYHIPISMAAKWMGHDVQIHTKVYQAWISSETENAIYLQAIQGAGQRFAHGLNDAQPALESSATDGEAGEADNHSATTEAANHSDTDTTAIDEGETPPDLAATETLAPGDHHEADDAENSMTDCTGMIEEDISDQGAEVLNNQSPVTDEPSTPGEGKAMGEEQTNLPSPGETDRSGQAAERTESQP